MSLDYKILVALKDNPSPSMDNYDLAKVCGVDMLHIDEAAFYKFVTELRLLRDKWCIDCPANDLGFAQGANGHWITYRTQYRLTSHGHVFLDSVNKNTATHKFKGFLISTMKEAGRHIFTHAFTYIFLAVLAIAAAHTGFFKTTHSHIPINTESPKAREL